MGVYKSWGKQWNPSVRHAPGFQCECKTSFDAWSIFKQIPLLLGLGTHSHIKRKGHAGVAIFQCDECHEYFWFHLTTPLARVFRKKSVLWKK